MFRRLLLFLLAGALASAAHAQTTDPTPTPLPVFAIQPGQPVEGAITAASPRLRYSFSGDVGNAVSLRMETTSGDLDPFLVLLGPDGELIEQDDDSGGERNAAISVTLPRAGTFTVEATRFQQGGAASSGTFRLTLEIAGLSGAPGGSPLDPPPDFGVEPAPGLTAYQQPAAGALDDLVGRRYFAFRGQQGDLIRAIMTTTSGDLVPQVDVLNPNRLSILSSEAQPRAIESIGYTTLPETGWYLIEAGRRSGVGSFDLYVERLTSGAVLAPGDVVTGQITPQTSSISYVFNARINDLIAANAFATEEAGGLSPQLRLLDVRFQTIAEASGARFATLRASIPRSGTYVLQVSSSQPQATGGFNLRLTSVPVDVSKLPVSSISYNEQQRGFISAEQPISYYRFAGKAGERVTIEMRTTSGSLDPYLILSDGALVEELVVNDNVSGGRNARIVRYQLDKDGDYLILATRAGMQAGATTGGFDLALTVGELALAPGAVSAALSWGSAADLNLFVRGPDGRIVSWSNPTTPSGGTLQIDSNTNCQTTTDQPIEYIYWPEGRLLPGDYDVWAWYQNPCAGSLPVSFSLRLGVGGAAVLRTPDDLPALQPGQRFEASIRVLPDGTASALETGRITTPSPQQQVSEGGDVRLAYGESVTAALDDSVYARFYQFEGAAGDEVTLTVETVSGNLDPIVILRDAADATLPGGTNDDAGPQTRDSRLTYTLPADGQYIVAVTRYGLRDGTTSGSFRLTLTNGAS